jgi:hypothetical protein
MRSVLRSVIRPGTPRRPLTAALAATTIALMPLLAFGASGPADAAAGNDTGYGNGEIRPFEPGDDDVSPDVSAPKSNAPSHVPAKDVPRVAGLPVSGSASGVGTRIDGLTLRDQRTSNGGNSFSLEPPDQGLCVGNGLVLEAVNNVFSTYTTAGAPVSGPQSFAPFWNNGAAEVTRAPDGTITSFGPFVSDPKCYYDPDLGRFFLTELQLGTNPATGDFNGDSFENIAVSRTSSPGTSAADWFLYRLNVRNDGSQGTPAHTGCPCLGDQPLIGADANGFYVSTNEFPLFSDGFNGAQFYAFDKVALTRGTMKVQRIEQNGTPLAEGLAYSVQPATSPTSGEWSTDANGTEYFLSALEFTGHLDNRIAAWAMTNTGSLRTGNPDVHLTQTVLGSEVYGLPPAARQKSGPVPLARSVHAKEELIQSNDDRMNQVVFAGGRLWSGLNTAVRTRVGGTSAGIAYFVVSPGLDGSQVTATMANQGYVAVDRNSTIFPAIGVTPSGNAVMVFTLTGDDYYPSAAVVHLDSDGAVSSGVETLAAGRVPDDGFTGYAAFGGNGAGRWGDYSAAVADSAGTVWVATEYIPGTFGFPPFLANWGTYVAGVTP